MKCTNCGKNNAVSHYRYEVNGSVTEAHLCAECAEKLRPDREFAARSREMFGDMFGGGLLGGGLWNTRGLLDGFFGRDPLDGFFGGGFFPMVMAGTPRIEISFTDPGALKPEDGGADTGVDPEISKKRQINALREQMRAAAEREDYEKAASIRDKLRELEGDGE